MIETFHEFLVHRSPALSRTAYLTGDHQLAEDLVQTALAATYRHWRRVQATATPRRTSAASCTTNRSPGGAAGGAERSSEPTEPPPGGPQRGDAAASER